MSFIISLLSKESTLPLLLGIPVALYFFRNASIKSVFKITSFLIVPVVIYFVIRQQALGNIFNTDVNVTGIMNEPFFDASPSQKAGTIIYTLLLYIKLLFVPHPLTHDYYPYHISLLEPYHLPALISLIVLLALIGVGIKGSKSRNKIAYVIFYFFITISIVSNVIVNVGTFMNERFLFVSSFALSLLVLVIAERVREKNNLKILFLILIGIFVLGFTYKTAIRIPDWKNTKTLNRAAIKVSKNSARANCFYGVSIYNEILETKEDSAKSEMIAEAQKHINRSLEIYPEYADALKMKAGLAAEQYKLDKDTEKLLDIFLEVLKVRRIAFVDEFIDWLSRRADKNRIAEFYFESGYQIFATEKQNFNLANHYLQKGYLLMPENEKIVFGNCVVNYLTGKFDNCIQFGTEYLTKFGENAEILYYLGNAQVKTGNPETGRQNIQKAFQLKPELKNKTQ